MSNAAALNRTEFGFVFPFLKDEGSSKFNLELFHRWRNYRHFQMVMTRPGAYGSMCPSPIKDVIKIVKQGGI